MTDDSYAAKMARAARGAIEREKAQELAAKEATAAYVAQRAREAQARKNG